MSAAITLISDLSDHQRRDLDEMVKDQPELQDVPWENEVFDSFMIDIWHHPVGVYVVHCDFRVCKFYIWILPEKQDAETSNFVVEAIAGHLLSREVKLVSQATIVGIDDASKKKLMTILTAKD